MTGIKKEDKTKQVILQKPILYLQGALATEQEVELYEELKKKYKVKSIPTRNSVFFKGDKIEPCIAVAYVESLKPEIMERLSTIGEMTRHYVSNMKIGYQDMKNLPVKTCEIIVKKLKGKEDEKPVA